MQPMIEAVKPIALNLDIRLLYVDQAKEKQLLQYFVQNASYQGFVSVVESLKLGVLS